MKAEIISVGTELLLGHTLNSDAAIIARELACLGIDLLNVQTVGDNPQRLRDALALAAGRSSIIITTGGLGPTDDDLTKNVIADFAGAPLEENVDAALRLKEYFGTRQMSANQIRQAFLPRGAVMFANNIGTAPGCAVPLPDGGQIIMLPGPPRELEAMLEESVVPFLQRFSNAYIHSTIIRTFGIGEGAAAEKISDLMAGANPTVAPYAQGGEMFVKVTARAEDERAARMLAEPVAKEVAARLGDYVYGRDIDSLAAMVVNALATRGMTVATAESCTGGLLAQKITDIPGASEVFHSGVVVYANEAKQELLNVPTEILAGFGAVSVETARLMAENVRMLAHSDLGIGITGIAGPSGGSELKPVGLVYIALAGGRQTWLREMRPQGKYLGRQWVRERAASIALDMTRRLLAGLNI